MADSSTTRSSFSVLCVVALVAGCHGPSSMPDTDAGAQADLFVTDAEPADDAQTDTSMPVPELVVDFGAEPAGPPGQTLTSSEPAFRSTLCMATHIPLGDGAAATSEREFALSRLEELGVSWIRQDFYWDSIESTPTVFDFSDYDRLVGDAAAHGIGVVALLVYGNPWATVLTEDDIYYPPDDPADFAAFAGQTAEHFRGSVSRFEIWNEANAGFRFYKPNDGGDPAGYAALVAAAAAAVKMANPSAKVALGGLVYHAYSIVGTESALDFLAAMFGAVPDFGADLDAVGVHPYMLYPPTQGPESAENGQIPMTEMLRSSVMLAAQHGLDLALWSTEFGWPDWGITVEQQRDFLARSMLLAYATGSDLNCWYTLFDEAQGIPTERQFGLMGVYDPASPARPKPAFDTFRRLSEALGEAHLGRDLSGAAPTDAGTHIITFLDDDSRETRVAVWAEHEAHRFGIPVADSVMLARQRRLDADEVDVTPIVTIGDTRAIVVEIGPTPVILELE